MPSEDGISVLKTFGVRIGMGLVDFSLGTLVGIRLLLQGENVWGITALMFGMAVSCLAIVQRNRLIFRDGQVVQILLFRTTAIAYSDIQRVTGEKYGITIYGKNQTITLPLDALFTSAAWVQLANQLAKVAPHAEFDEAARKLVAGEVAPGQKEVVGTVWLAGVAFALLAVLLGIAG